MQYNGNQDYLEKVAARSLAQMLYPAWEKAKGLGSSLGKSVGRRFRRGAKTVADATGVTEAMTGAPYQVVSDNLPSARRAKALQEFSDLISRKQLPPPSPGAETADAINARQAALRQLHDADVDASAARQASSRVASDDTVKGILDAVPYTAPEADPVLSRKLRAVLGERIDPTVGNGAKNFSNGINQKYYPWRPNPETPWFADSDVMLGDRLEHLFRVWEKTPEEGRPALLQPLINRGDAAKRAIRALPPEWQSSLNIRGSVAGMPVWSAGTWNNWLAWLATHPEAVAALDHN